MIKLLGAAAVLAALPFAAPAQAHEYGRHRSDGYVYGYGLVVIDRLTPRDDAPLQVRYQAPEPVTVSPAHHVYAPAVHKPSRRRGKDHTREHACRCPDERGRAHGR